MEDRSLTGELGRGRVLRIRGQPLVAIDELADVVLELRHLAEHPVDLLEKGDDLALGGFALGVSRRAPPLELPGDSIVFAAQRRDRCFYGHVAPCRASFSFALSSLFVFKTTIKLLNAKEKLALQG